MKRSSLIIILAACGALAALGLMPYDSTKSSGSPPSLSYEVILGFSSLSNTSDELSAKPEPLTDVFTWQPTERLGEYMVKGKMHEAIVDCDSSQQQPTVSLPPNLHATTTLLLRRYAEAHCFGTNAIAKSGEIHGVDTNGPYIGLVVAMGQGLQRIVTRSKIRYERPVPHIKSAVLAITGEPGLPSVIREQETLTYALAGSELATTSLNIEAHLVGKESRARVEAHREGFVVVSNVPSHTEPRAKIAAARVSRIPPLELLERFQQVSKNTAQQTRNELLLDLEAYALASDNAGEQIASIISDSSPDHQQFHIGLASLVSAGTSSCQRSLIDLINRHDSDSMFLAGTLPYLGQLKRPEHAIVRRVLSLHKTQYHPRVKVRALLSYGSLLNGLNKSDNAAYREEIADLIQLSAAAAVEDRSLALDALGNAGTSDAFHAVSQFLKDSSEDIRAAALGALRKDRTEANAQSIIDRLRDEQATAVLLVGAKTLTELNLSDSSVRHLREIDMTKHAPQVRGAFLLAVARSSASTATIRAFLEQAGAGESSAEVRAYAHKLLAQ